jgi:hypothetical protein
VTRVVVLNTAPPSTNYDEVAVFNKALASSTISAIFAAQSVDYRTDPQVDPGWEELYGLDQPRTPGDVPVIANGLCRVMYTATYAAYIVEVFMAGIGYVEIGRVTTWCEESGTVIQHGVIQDATVQEWTPERGVIRVVTSATSSGKSYRMETYVTLQRGWTGPRFECYPSPNTAGSPLGAHIRWSAAGAADLIGLVTGATTRPLIASELGAVWPAGPLVLDANGEPWFAVYGGDRTVVMKPTRIADKVRTYDDTVAYGALRKAVALCSDYGTAQAGYISARIGLAPAAIQTEAEAIRNVGSTQVAASATAAVVVEAGTSGGSVVEESQGAETASTLVRDPTILTPGKWAIWIRARVVNAGATGSFRAGFVRVAPAYNSSTGLVTTTSTTYTWLYLGEATAADTQNYFYVNAFRSAGTGTVRIDKVLAVPMEMRTTAPPSYDGVRDQALANLYDTRVVPELVSR